jgi:hypothetical protein
VNATSNPIVELRAELRSAASRRLGTARRRRRLIVLGVVAVACAGTSLSIAANGWLTGEPAPPPVVADFKAYTPQLGFHPEPGKAVLVAQDGAIKLYATTNREGTYCYVTDTPWKHPTVHDGGTCIPPELPTGPISAGIVGLTNDGTHETYVVGGRVAAPARSIRFKTPSGESIERRLGRAASTSLRSRSRRLVSIGARRSPRWTPRAARSPRRRFASNARPLRARACSKACRCRTVASDQPVDSSAHFRLKGHLAAHAACG